MKKSLKWLTVLIVITCIVIPIIDYSGIKDFALTATTMLSGLCGLATLFVAILLYDRYGMESKAKETTLKSIEETIAELQKVDFTLCYYADSKDGSTPENYIIPLSFQSKKERVTEYFTPEDLSSLLYYKGSAMYVCSQLVDNINSKVFLPKTIADAVQKLFVFKYESQDIPKDTRPITTISGNSEKISCLNDSLDGTNTNVPEEQYSVIQFVDAYFGVKEAIVDWYKKNNIDMGDLNLV